MLSGCSTVFTIDFRTFYINIEQFHKLNSTFFIHGRFQFHCRPPQDTGRLVWAELGQVRKVYALEKIECLKILLLSCTVCLQYDKV